MDNNDPTKILILAANPRRYEDLRLGEQVRDIKEGLARSRIGAALRDRYTEIILK